MIEPIKHYSLANIPTQYDEEALTVLELCARLGVKVNELIKWLNEQDEYIKTAIPGDIQKVVNKWLTDHPEATTTVRPGSLSPMHFTEQGKELVCNNYMTPEFFGAKGDGVTDDTEAIKSAIDTFKGHVGTVYLKEGQYRITEPIVIPSNINLVGAGSAKYGRRGSDIPTTVIFYDGDIEESMVKYERDGATVFGGSIRNLTLDGQGLVNHVVDLRRAGRVHIDRCSIVNALEDGIYAHSTYENIITNNWFSGNVQWAINMDTHANANTVENNAIELSGGRSGIKIYNGNGNIIRGNTIEGGFNTSIGVHVDGGNYASQNVITGNRIEFECHRYTRDKEGVCIQIGELGADLQPVRNFVHDNAVFNQVLFEEGGSTQINHLNEFVDYGIGTVTDFYDYTNINENPHMLTEDERVIGFQGLDDGFMAIQNERYTTIYLQGAVYDYPVYYKLIDGKQLRGENIAVSCKLNPKEKPIRLEVEFYRGGTAQGWEGKGELISRKSVVTLEVGYDQLLHVQGVVPYDCDTIAVYFNFLNKTDSHVNVHWLKIGNNVTWR